MTNTVPLSCLSPYLLGATKCYYTRLDGPSDLCCTTLGWGCSPWRAAAKDWEVKLCDLNVQALAPDELQWADAVFLSGMLVQRDSLLELAAQARPLASWSWSGGPVATTSPELLTPYADCVVSGEAEELMAPLCEALAQRGRPARTPGRAPSP